MNRVLTALLFLAVAVLSADAGAWIAHFELQQKQARTAAPPVRAALPALVTASPQAPVIAAKLRRPKQVLLERKSALPAGRSGSRAAEARVQSLRSPRAGTTVEAAHVDPATSQPPGLEGPPPPNPAKTGVLIVISLPAQRAFVFKDGEAWASTRISTGRPGKRTPVGTFTILEKQLIHHSTTYDDAPMPYMQRITWGGVALHAGRVPGYPASHGCIRMPRAFARRLYGITNYSSTVVRITNKRITSEDDARKLG